MHGSWWRRHLPYLLLGLLIKGLSFWFFVRSNDAVRHMGQWALWDADTWEYVDPVESYIRGDGFDPDHRMPGYAIPYLLLRTVLAPAASTDVLTLLQLLLATLASYALARGIVSVTGRAVLFWPAYTMLLVSVFHSSIEMFVINESFTTSALVLHWVTYVAFRRTGSRAWLITSGAFLAWAIFMRPIYGPLIGLVPLLEFLRRDLTMRRRITAAVLFMAPFVVADTGWVLRNARAHGGFHPLTNHGSYNPSYTSSPFFGILWFVQGYGGKHSFWDPTADILWYGFVENAGAGTNTPVPGVSEPPGYVYTTTYDKDSLVALAALMRRTRMSNADPVRNDSLARVILRTAERYREAFAREHPVQYHVMARLRMLKHETIHSGTPSLFQRPFHELGPLRKGYKVFQSVLYWAVHLLGVVGSLVLLRRFRRSPGLAMMGAMVLYGVLACPIIMRMGEMRYLIPTYPLACMVALLVGSALLRRLSAGRQG